MLGLKLTRKSGGTFRTTCPVCKSDDPNSVIITPTKGVFHCFRCKDGGNILHLVARARGNPPKKGLREAAIEITEFFGGDRTVQRDSTVHKDSTVPASVSDLQTARLEKILERLQPTHEAVQDAGISPETAEAWESGYNVSGPQRGRYSVALHDPAGRLIGFLGIALDAKEPKYIWPDDIDPAQLLFNAHRVEPGTVLYLARTPRDAILATEHGVENWDRRQHCHRDAHRHPVRAQRPVEWPSTRSRDWRSSSSSPFPECKSKGQDQPAHVVLDLSFFILVK